ncbi:MAG: 7-carboxy-7-deazaguanine synthase [Candidatus Neomarinimicrobiota bacterium]|tara:strand:- start:76 stop:708 length:633 start_codon:yes stop_codon:yes gene_type:complete
MIYSVKEIYFTMQGEGFHTGKHAVFCRFTGCNLWSGIEKDRANAICNFCDTDFVGIDGVNGSKYISADNLSDKIEEVWGKFNGEKFVVFTGGEPLLQLNSELIEALHKRGFKIAVETNGTLLPPENIDWICVSPKKGAKFELKYGNELKLVYPQEKFNPSQFKDLEFDHFFLQPMDGKYLQRNILQSVSYCIENPLWRLSLQTHKIMGID